MKISILSTYDSGGGAARSSHRLYRGLINNGKQVRFFTQNKRSDDPTDSKISRLHKFINLLRPFLDNLPNLLYPKRERKGLFSCSIIPVSCWIKRSAFKADILNFHWVASGFISIESFKKVKAPIVWTLHDSWAFTGGCHLPENCINYYEKCGQCPQLNSSNKYDLSRINHKRKRNAWNELNMTIVTPSRWLAECARKSSLFKNNRIEVIPNGIDISIFKPLDKKLARESLGLNASSRLILFGAVDATSDINKGFHFIEPMLKDLVMMPDMQDVKLIIFGAANPANPIESDFDIHYIGRFNDDVALALIYSAADVMLVPSMQENLPNTVMESMSCGTPVVGFNIGGMSDLIDHNHNGYLAKAYDVQDLANGLHWAIRDENLSKQLGARSRSKIIDSFDISLITQRYIKLFDELINEDKSYKLLKKE